jgi:hypothetical protein
MYPTIILVALGYWCSWNDKQHIRILTCKMWEYGPQCQSYHLNSATNF